MLQNPRALVITHVKIVNFEKTKIYIFLSGGHIIFYINRSKVWYSKDV